ncbi:hypothetical protein Syun_007266 [Stephania yunnanensis]|uniref:U6 snRNA-associated Sm-like protein LSm4 n=1 Tax=Stephania yunnanensis TaxID=152371 RepID=A0AAP0KZ79_9MAGN
MSASPFTPADRGKRRAQNASYWREKHHDTQISGVRARPFSGDDAEANTSNVLIGSASGWCLRIWKKMLPLSLLKTAQGHPMLVELKNGETYNGHLVNCDTWMNIHLREDGDRFWRMPECYIRGNTIKYLRVPDEVCL